MNPFQEVVLDPNKLAESMFIGRMDGDESKRKNLELMRVLKGALSMSKSTTFDETYRHNKQEEEFLKKSQKVLTRNIYYTAISHNSKKRNVLRRWNLKFGKQKSMNHSIHQLDEFLTQAIDETQNSVLAKEEPCGYRGKKREKETTVHFEDESEENKTEEEVKEPEPEIIMNANDNLNRRGIPQLKLPKTVGIGKATRVIEEEKPKVKPPTPKPLTLAERSKGVTNYIENQKLVHDELVQRNILQRVKSDLSEKDMLYRFQLRSQLPDNPNSCIETLKNVAKVRVGTAESTQKGSLLPALLTARSLQRLQKTHRKSVSVSSNVKYTSQSTRSLPPRKPSFPSLERTKTMFV